MGQRSRRAVLKALCLGLGVGSLPGTLAACGSAARAPAATVAPVAATEVPESAAVPEATVAPAEAPTEVVALRWVDEGGVLGEPAEEQEHNDGVCALFHEQNPDITVVYEPGVGDWFEKLTAQMVSGDAPDVFAGYGSYFKLWAEKGQVLGLDSGIEKEGLADDLDDFFPNPLAGCRYKGSLIGMPKYLNVVIMYYNQDMLDAAGEKYPSGEWSWDDLRVLALALTDADKPLFGITSAFGLTRLDICSVWSHCGNVVDPDDDTKVLLDSEETIAGLQVVHDMIWKDGSFGLTEMMGGLKTRGAFSAKMCALLTAGSGEVTLVRDGVDFGWDLLNTPNGPCGVGTRTSMDAYHVYGKTPHPDEAFRFLAFLESKEMCLDRLQYGLTAPRRSLTGEWEALMPEKNLKAVSQVMETCRPDVRAMVRDAQEFADIWDPLYDQCMLLNKITVEELVTEASLQLRALYESA